jgi:hypothetical protein
MFSKISALTEDGTLPPIKPYHTQGLVKDTLGHNNIRTLLQECSGTKDGIGNELKSMSTGC